MSILHTLLQSSLHIGHKITTPNQGLYVLQYRQLHDLLEKARKTAFGRHYSFREILSEPNIVAAYQETVPVHDYDQMYQQWWRIARTDEPDVAWPERIPYYALSSGTAGASSKYIPVTHEMLRMMKKGTRRMLFSLSNYMLPDAQLTHSMLMVGSCTAPTAEGKHHVGDLSGIIGQNRPIWLERAYRPSKSISNMENWDSRLKAIVHEAPNWDIGLAVGNPAWVQILLERILAKYQLNHIHEIWPNFNLYVHGGIFFDPYRDSFEKLLGQPVQYMDSYMASEGFIGFQDDPQERCMKLLADCGIFFEFIPFSPAYFDEDGNLLPTQKKPKALTINEVKEGETYAIVLSTCAGAWRYLLGDTVQFTNACQGIFRITGRTKQFLSVCGEHLSVDNLNEAVRRTNSELNAGIREFTVAGIREGHGWAHQWYISLDNPNVTADNFVQTVDRFLQQLNDDYAVERAYALHSVRCKILPNQIFFDWLAQKGKLNGQAKIPRVMKGVTLECWQAFNANISNA